MPSINIPIFSFAGIYLGNYGVASPLTQIFDMRTNGAQLNEKFPTDFVSVLGNRIQSENHSFDVTLTFYSDADVVSDVSRGRPINDSNAYGAPGNQLYSLLLVDPFATDSFFFPKISTVKSRTTEYRKDKPIATEVQFRAENRDPNVVLAYQSSVANLIGIMGAQSPF